MRLGPSRQSIKTGDGLAVRPGPRPWPPAFIPPAITVVLGLLVLLPVAALIRAALIRGNWVHLDLARALLASVSIATLATAVAAAAGLGIAALLSMRDVPFARLIRSGVTATLLIPSFGFAIGWQAIAPSAAPGLLLVLALAASSVAPMFLAARWALVRGGPDAGDADRMYSVSMRIRVARQLQGAAPLLSAAVVLTFARALADLGAPLLLGTPMLTTEILRAHERAPNGATAAAAALLLCACIALLLRLAAQLNRSTPRGEAQDASVASLGELGTWRWPAFAVLLGALAVLIGLPLASLSAKAIPALRFDAFHLPLVATLSAALPAATLALLLAGAAACLSHRPAARSASLATTLCLLPAAVPGLALALGGAAAFSSWLTNTPLILMLIITAISLPAVLHHVREGLSRMPPDEEHAARMHGADRRAVFAGLLLPQLLPRFIGAWALVFASACREVPASLLLTAPGARTLTTESFDQAHAGNLGQAAALAFVTIALSACVMAIATRVSGEPLLAPRR
jgi:iron(III) transport system permease protein